MPTATLHDKEIEYALPPSLLDLTAKELRPMTRDESEMFINVTMSRLTAPEQFSEPVSEDHEMFQGNQTGGFLRSCVLLRCQMGGVGLTKDAVTLPIVWGADRPGTLVMWAYTFVRLARKLGKTVITGEDIVEAFPMGIPTEEGCHRIWDAQKLEGTGINTLDMSATWEAA